jgi:hypothetical protein
MSHWPEQPVNIIIEWLKDHSLSLVIADFGCGERFLNSFSFCLVLIIAMSGDLIVQRRCEPLRFLLLTPARSLLPRLG